MATNIYVKNSLLKIKGGEYSSNEAGFGGVYSVDYYDYAAVTAVPTGDILSAA
jgi:hypothetical protein